MKAKYFFILLIFMCLFSFNIRSQTYPWPINDTSVVHRIYGGYGEYEFDGSDLYFHEGLDLINPIGTPVVAVCNGRIVEKMAPQNDIQNTFIRLGLGTDTNIENITKACLYLHIIISNHYMQARSWWIGDSLKQGDTIGTIGNYNGFTTHLHFEYNNKENSPNWAQDSLDINLINIADLEGNPITILNPRTDNVHPKIDTTVYCRYGQDEGKIAARYFKTRNASGKKVVKGPVDLIVMAGDSFASFPTNYLINILKIGHKVKALKGNAGYNYQQAIDFSGRFLNYDNPDSSQNGYSKFRPPESELFTDVIYENDATCTTSFRYLPDSTNQIQRIYYYNLTNIDTVNTTIQKSDSLYFWNTVAIERSGAHWNNVDTIRTNGADSNNVALFPDGLYTINVLATGYGGDADTSSMNYTILVNNFNENIYSCASDGTPRDSFCTGEPVYVKGIGFPKNQSFRVFVMKDTVWTDNKYFVNNASRVTAITVTTDTTGKILPTMLWNSYSPNGLNDKGYSIVLDYDGDSLFTSKREGFTVDVKDSSINGTKSIIGVPKMKTTFTGDSCFADCKGTAIYELKGWRPPYYIFLDLLPVIVSDSVKLDSLCGGLHIITILDSSCTLIDTFNINEPFPLLANCAPTYVPPCDMAGNYGIVAAGSGGNPPYHFLWNTGDTTQFLDVSVFGLYTCSVTDSTGCADSCSTLIYSPLPLSSAPIVDPVNCVNNGAIHLNITGGLPPYNIYWQTPTGYYGYTSEDFINLFDTGLYVAYINDRAGCLHIDSVYLPGNPVYVRSWFPGYVNCGPNGSIFFNVGFGNPPFTFSWTGPNGFTSSSESLDSLSIPGIYIIHVTEGSGCSSTDSIFLDGRPAIHDTTIVTPLTCTTPGQIQLIPSGGTPPFSYNWSTSWGFVSHQKDITNLLVTGYYKVVINDSAGCSLVDSINLTGNQHVTVFGFTTPVNCNSNGAITVFPFSGNPPFSFNWIGPDSFASTNQSLTGLSKPGMYILNTTDHNGCMHTDTFNLTGNPPLTLSTVLSPVLCGANGAISLTVSGGTSPFSYQWSGPAAFSATIQNLNGLSIPGSYSVTVTDSHGCTSTTTNILGGSLNVQCSNSVVPVNCGTPGSINTTVSGGTQPFSFLWNGPNNFTSNLQNISGLINTGTYNLIVTDINGCFCVSAPLLNGSSPISSCALSSTPLSCGSSGLISSLIIGGTSPYSYNWNGPSGYFSTSQNISGLTVTGTYTFTVTDVHGCTCSSSTTLGGIQPVGCNANATPISCNVAGSIQGIVSGGTTPFFYSWSGPGGYSSNSQNISGLTVPGNYTFHVQDVNGCTCNKVVMLNGGGGLGCSISLGSITCHGAGNGTLTAVPTGGVSPFSYSWSNSLTSSGISGLLPGNYSVTVTDANGCTTSSSATLSDPPAILISITGRDSLCIGDTLLLSGSSTGGTGSIIYSWSGPAGFSSIMQNISIPNSSLLNSGIYSLTVTDANGCIANDNDTINIQNCSLGITLNTKVYIQGYYIGGGLMRAVIQPISYPSICDTIVVQLAGSVYPHSIIYSCTTLLSTAGVAISQFPSVVNGNSYYIVLHHRNALETWSANPVSLDSSVVTYSFISSASKAFGNNLMNLGDGNFAMYSGDVVKDGIINNTDYLHIENAALTFSHGYFSDDLTGDNIVEDADFSLIENNSLMLLVVLHP